MIVRTVYRLAQSSPTLMGCAADKHRQNNTTYENFVVSFRKLTLNFVKVAISTITATFISNFQDHVVSQ
jgi:hypothetical protein